ncbi:LysE family translocator [Nocardia vaccinii]|uniref:LysE family translocator n=1 Tax=Nocardia vaccinii TaxID=1822 RepID=UPI000832588B|nr:LysE family translocator [Nocardia vaccinii]
MLVSLASFSVAAVLLVVLPGPDTLVVLRGLVRGGRGGGIRTSLGVLCGLLVWVGAAVLGLSALLRASEIGYEVLKIAGACYLVWMGVQSLRSLRRSAPGIAQGSGTPPAQPSMRSGGFVAGFLTDILNPKIGVLFVGFLPGFVPAGYSVGWTTLGLGAMYVVLTAVYFAVLVVASSTVAGWMQTRRVRRRLDSIAGLVLIGFGIRLATES